MTTHICLVLDRSGSMQSIRDDALGSVNGYIMAAKQDRALQAAKFSLLTFSSEGIVMVRSDVAMEAVSPITNNEYHCAGWTPLYDAIGRGIGWLDNAYEDDVKLKVADNANTKFILVVMTDGQENASKEFSFDKIKALIDMKQKDGWLIVFLGEGLDVAKQGASLGTSVGSTASYASANLRHVGAVVAASNARFVASGQSAGDFTAEERAKMAGPGVADAADAAADKVRSALDKMHSLLDKPDK